MAISATAPSSGGAHEATQEARWFGNASATSDLVNGVVAQGAGRRAAGVQIENGAPGRPVYPPARRLPVAGRNEVNVFNVSIAAQRRIGDLPRLEELREELRSLPADAVPVERARLLLILIKPAML